MNILGTCYGTCPNSGSVFNGACYYYVSTTMTFSAADQNCVDAFGGRLTSIHSSDEYNFLQSIKVYVLLHFNLSISIIIPTHLSKS